MNKEKVSKEIEICKEEIEKLRININQEKDLNSKLIMFREFIDLNNKLMDLNKLHTECLLEEFKTEIRA